MIQRHIKAEFLAQLNEFPIVTVLGPRQAGKTTLVRNSLPDYAYASLEDPEKRSIAEEDPKAFLKSYPGKTIFDEIQRAPHLLSYIQGIVDEEQTNGRYVLTGSHQLELRSAVTQSLAGRTGILHLLPLSIGELKEAGIKFDTFEEYLFHGFLPRVYDQKQRPRTAYSSYYQTYVERDVRQLLKLKDAALFEKFLKLLAGRVGQIINYSSLSNDVGVDANTIKHWLSILEASYIVFKLSPYFQNIGKRVIKSPKYYFTDTGLLSFLLGIEKTSQISRDPLVGNIFENMVILEAIKTRYNMGLDPNLYFSRDNRGHEVDLLYKVGSELTGIEIKSSSTYNSSFKKGLLHFSDKMEPLARSFIVFSGDAQSFSDGIQALPFDRVADIFQ